MNRFSKFAKYFGNYIVISVFAIVMTILAMTGSLRTSTTVILEKITINIVLAITLSLVVGFLGELSLGHAGFMCIGAYIGGKTAVLLTNSLGGTSFLTVLIAMIVGGLAAALCGFIVGLPALRLKGDYLAITTLAFGEIVKVIFQQSKHFGGNLGLATPRFSSKLFFVLGFGIVLFTLMIIQNLMRSKHGRAITAIRDNEIAAKATGVNVTKYKLTAFIISAFFAGIAGVMFSYTNSTIQATKFDYNYSIEILVMVVLGGMGSINGAIIASTLIAILNEKLRTVLTGDTAILKDLIYAAILIIIVIYKNAPALAGFREKYNIHTLVNKIRKHNPARIMDDQAEWGRVPTKIPMNEVLRVDIKDVDENPDAMNIDKEVK